MEQPRQKATGASQAISMQPGASSNDTEKQITGWLILCATHFRVDLNDAEIAIYQHALRGIEPGRLDTAFQRCLRECEFMPKLVDVCNRLPEAQEPPQHTAPIEEFVKDAETWTEETATFRLTYRGDPKGYKQVIKMERR